MCTFHYKIHMVGFFEGRSDENILGRCNHHVTCSGLLVFRGQSQTIACLAKRVNNCVDHRYTTFHNAWNSQVTISMQFYAFKL